MTATEQSLSARRQLVEWVSAERDQYADVKFGDDGENRASLIDEMRDAGFHDRWLDFALNYVKRAQLVGADTPAGRQLMGKAIVTLQHMLETAIVLFGDMPEPGHPSGDVRSWLEPSPSTRDLTSSSGGSQAVPKAAALNDQEDQ